MKTLTKIAVAIIAIVASIQTVLTYAGVKTPEQEIKDRLHDVILEEKTSLETQNMDEASKAKADALLTKLEATMTDGVKHDGEPGP